MLDFQEKGDAVMHQKGSESQYMYMTHKISKNQKNSHLSLFNLL